MDRWAYITGDDICSMQGKDLAALLGVTRVCLLEAALNNRFCAGFDVAKWAVRDINGRLLAYYVPLLIYNHLLTIHEYA